jgi:hypothetical protein
MYCSKIHFFKYLDDVIFLNNYKHNYYHLLMNFYLQRQVLIITEAFPFGLEFDQIIG